MKIISRLFKLKNSERKSDKKIECISCQEKILLRTATKTGGLCIPCYRGTRDFTKLKIKREKEKFENSATAHFFNAVKNNNVSDIIYWVNKGVDVNAKNFDGETALLISTNNASMETINILLNDGADINIPDRQEETPLIAASINNNIELVNIFISNGADIDAQNLKTSDGDEWFHGFTALMEAAKAGHIDTVKLLINRGANLNKSDAYGTTALSLSVQYGHKSIVELLLKNGADVNKVDGGNSILILSIEKKQKEFVKLLIDYGADINFKNYEGKTALMIAILEMNEIIEYLINKGAEIELKDKNGNSALITASHYHKVEITKLLLNKGADVNNINNQGQTALMATVDFYIFNEFSYNRVISIIDLLLKNGANINAQNVNGKTSLMFASLNSHKVLVEFLFERGANLYLLNKDGYSILSLLIFQGYKSDILEYKDLIEFVLENDTGFLIKNMIDMSPKPPYYWKKEEDELLNKILQIGECFIKPLVTELIDNSDWSYQNYIANILKYLNWKPVNLTESLFYFTALGDIESLANLGADGVPALVSLLNVISYRSPENSKIAEMLSNMAIKESIEALIPLINDDSKTSWVAARTLGELGNPIALKSLITALENQEYQDEAKRILIKFDRKAIQSLIDEMTNKTTRQKKLIGKILLEITGETFGKNEIKWKEWLDEQNL